MSFPCIVCGANVTKPDAALCPECRANVVALVKKDLPEAWAVFCVRCGCLGRSDEMKYYDHGGGVCGYECEPCQAQSKEDAHALFLQFQKKLAEARAAAVEPGGAKTIAEDLELPPASDKLRHGAENQ